MLRKDRLSDDGMKVEQTLVGPGVFLDVWAVRELSKDSAAPLRDRFANALKGHQGSLLVSSPWVTELETIKGDARTRAQDFFASLGRHWLFVNPVTSVVASTESAGGSAYLSNQMLDGYVKERCGELQRDGKDPHSLADDEFFDLARTLVWTSGGPGAKPNQQLQDLKDVALSRAKNDEAEERRDRTAHDRLYPLTKFAVSRITCVHNAIWRETTRRSLQRKWMPNDGFDVSHLIPALLIGGFIAVDGDWKEMGEVTLAELPTGHARLYRPGELEQLVTDLEAWRP